MTSRRWEDLPESQIGRVLILYTGGTIGMKDKGNGFEPAPGFIHQTLASLSMFHDPSFGSPSLQDQNELMNYTFVSPILKTGLRAVYKVIEYIPILDSCNISTKDWSRISQDISCYYNDWDGFIILHGTDTMAYTASALSFMLENLGKTVVITGSQIPLSVPLNDAISNLLGALTVASSYETPEVLLHFNGASMRGNRTTKSNASGLQGFTSANFRPLIELGVDYKVDWDRMLPPPTGPFRANDAYDSRVAVFRLFPGFDIESLRNALRPPLRGLVLQTFGAGNAPDSAVSTLQEAAERGVIIVNVTQCQKGMVEAHYAVGVALRRAGVVPGYDMTVEAALTKLGHLLGSDMDSSAIRDALEKDFRGELTVHTIERFSFKDSTFISSVYSALHSGAKPTGKRAEGEMKFIGGALFPVLLCAAAAKGDCDLMKRMVSEGAEVNGSDYDNRTALHVAAAEGHFDACRTLLELGANVNLRDRAGVTALHEAVRCSHDSVARLLFEAQGELHMNRTSSATILLSAAATGDAKQVDRWISFGVSVDVNDYDLRTAGHIAACEGHQNVIEILKLHKARFDLVDRWGMTAIDDAKKCHPELLSLMC
jgi:60kDa lysophospholipase